MKEIISACKQGFFESRKMELEKRENWTPILIYIHVTRLILGFILGIGFGICIGISLYFLIFS